MPKYGYAESDWNAAKNEALLHLRHCARASRPTIAYSELAALIRSIPFQPDDKAYHHLLGEISEEENAEGRGMISVLVIHKGGDLMPGPGFFELARKLGRPQHDKLRLWTEEFERVVVANGGKIRR